MPGQFTEFVVRLPRAASGAHGGGAGSSHERRRGA